jgi:hypothetical protein
MTRSIKKLNICASWSRALMNFSSSPTRVTIFGKHVMPAEEIDPAPLGNVELTL